MDKETNNLITLLHDTQITLWNTSSYWKFETIAGLILDILADCVKMSSFLGFSKDHFSGDLKMF